jgi:serine/threonine protein kinase
MKNWLKEMLAKLERLINRRSVAPQVLPTEARIPLLEPVEQQTIPEPAQNTDSPEVVKIRRISADAFELTEPLGTGNFSAVYKGRWDNKTVAIKKIWLRGAEDNEVGIMFELNHPNIVKLHGIFQAESNSNPVLIIEFKENGSLFDFVRNHRHMTYIVENRVKISQNIAAGLDYLEKSKVIHRDIKPENILLGKDGVATIADYGLAVKYTGEVYESKYSSGSPYYVAPEVLRKNGNNKYEYTPKVDVYGLGGIIYYLWDFKVPYQSVETDRDVLSLKKQGKHDTPSSGTPPHIRSLILNLWSFEPKSRFTAAEIIPALKSAPETTSTAEQPSKAKPEFG